MVCPTNMTALSGEAALFVQGYECNSSIAPCDFDRVISGYGLTQTALFGDPYCCTAASARDSFGRQHATCRSMENGVPWHISAAEVVFAIVVAAAFPLISTLCSAYVLSVLYHSLAPRHAILWVSIVWYGVFLGRNISHRGRFPCRGRGPRSPLSLLRSLGLSSECMGFHRMLWHVCWSRSLSLMDFHCYLLFLGLTVYKTFWCYTGGPLTQ